MAEKPGDIEREIADLRESIAAKLDGLSGRVGSDWESARDRAGERIPSRADLDTLVHDHPLAAAGIAFGLGALLGSVTPSASTVGHGASRGADATAPGGGLLAALLIPLQQPIQDEITRMVRQMAAGFGAEQSAGERRNGSREPESAGTDGRGS